MVKRHDVVDRPFAEQFGHSCTRIIIKLRFDMLHPSRQSGFLAADFLFGNPPPWQARMKPPSCLSQSSISGPLVCESIQLPRGMRCFLSWKGQACRVTFSEFVVAVPAPCSVGKTSLRGPNFGVRAVSQNSFQRSQKENGLVIP